MEDNLNISSKYVTYDTLKAAIDNVRPNLRNQDIYFHRCVFVNDERIGDLMANLGMRSIDQIEFDNCRFSPPFMRGLTAFIRQTTNIKRFHWMNCRVIEDTVNAIHTLFVALRDARVKALMVERFDHRVLAGIMFASVKNLTFEGVGASEANALTHIIPQSFPNWTYLQIGNINLNEQMEIVLHSLIHSFTTGTRRYGHLFLHLRGGSLERQQALYSFIIHNTFGRLLLSIESERMDDDLLYSRDPVFRHSTNRHVQAVFGMLTPRYTPRLQLGANVRVLPSEIFIMLIRMLGYFDTPLYEVSDSDDE